ncbi:Uncharacterised protein [Mycobacterium tuberculosis]|nr:Uncharacterised protein [Mycobacterium tuberculosis]
MIPLTRIRLPSSSPVMCVLVLCQWPIPMPPSTGMTAPEI